LVGVLKVSVILVFLLYSQLDFCGFFINVYIYFCRFFFNIYKNVLVVGYDFQVELLFNIVLRRWCS